MAQVIKIKRGLEASRAALPVATGEMIYTTDDYGVYFGTGASDGGTEIGYLSTTKGGSIAGNVSIAGNLTVTGDVTQTSTNNVIIGDAIMTLAADNIDNPIDNAGIEVYRGTTDDAVSILWNETSNYWQLTDATDTAGNTNTKRILDTSDILSAGTGINITTGTISATDLGSSQNIFKTVTGDTGTITAGSNTATFQIAGGAFTTTSVSGNVLTVTGENTTYTADAGHLSLTGTEFSHKTGSGHYHLTDTGVNNGKVLTASGSAGVFTWEDAGAATNNATITIAGDGTALVASAGDFTTNQASNETITVTHSTADGYKHVPVTGTSNDGKVLTAGATAGTFSWQDTQNAHSAVTLTAVASNYLTLTGQEITAGVVPLSLGGTGATSASAARTALGVDAAGTDNSPTVTMSGTPNYITAGGTKGHTLTLTKLNISDDTLMASSDSSLLISGNDVTVATVDGGTF